MSAQLDVIAEKEWSVSMRIKTALIVTIIAGFLMSPWKEWPLHLLHADWTIHFPRILGLTLIECVTGSLLAGMPVYRRYTVGIRIAFWLTGAAIGVDLRSVYYNSPLLLALIMLLWAAGLIAFALSVKWLFQAMDQPRFSRLWNQVAVLVAILGTYPVVVLFGHLFGADPAGNPSLNAVYKILLIVSGFRAIDAILEPVLLKWDRPGLLNYIMREYKTLVDRSI